jgi:hypothetical protein
MNPRKAKRKRTKSNKILRKGGMTPAEIMIGRMAAHAQNVAMLRNALEMFVTSGSKILIDDYGMTVDDAAEWSKKVIRDFSSELQAMREKRNETKSQ